MFPVTIRTRESEYRANPTKNGPQQITVHAAGHNNEESVDDMSGDEGVGVLLVFLHLGTWYLIKLIKVRFEYGHK
jgi:hypothetical protein